MQVAPTGKKIFAYSAEPDSILLERARELASAEKERARTLYPLLCFTVGDTAFAFHTGDVQQVVSGAHILSVPLTPDYILGLTIIRGRIVTVVDLAFLLAERNVPVTGSTHAVMVQYEEHAVCFAVEKTPSSINVYEDTIQYYRETQVGRFRELSHGFVEYNDAAIEILSPEKLLSHKFLTQLLSSPVKE